MEICDVALHTNPIVTSVAQVLPHFQLIFPSKIWFFGIYLNFHWQKSLKNQYLSHSKSKSYQINCIKSSHQDLSNNTKGTFRFLQSFQLWFYLIFSEEIIQYSKKFTPQVQMPWNQVDAPILFKSFSKRPRTQFEASRFGGSHISTNKTNKQPSFIDRFTKGNEPYEIKEQILALSTSI